MKNILEVKNLNVYYTDKGSLFHGKKEEKHALKNVSFTMREGEILGLVGESGCGKTSLAKALLGMQKKYDGEIRLDCANPQMVFQDPYGSLNPAKRIGWILEEPLRMKHAYSAEERRQKVDEMLDKVGLDRKCREHYPNELSGGQKQRVAIIRTLIMEPDIILFDEPTSALDPEMVGEVLELIKKVADTGKTMIIVSHEMNFVEKVSNRVLFVDSGKIVFDGKTKDFFSSDNERIKEFLDKIKK